MQVRDLVAHSVIFNKGYSYSSSTVPGLVEHFAQYARERALASSVAPKRLLEVGCNDGVFLVPLSECGYSVVGIDASENVAAMARARGLDVHLGVFGPETADMLLERYGRFDVVTCSNVFAHNPNVNDFAEAVGRVLTATGEFWVEVHDAQQLLEGLQWDCFYHEHCFYWSIQALARCLESAGLWLKGWTTTRMHGGSLRAVFQPRPPDTPITMPPKLGVTEWEAFRGRCLRSKMAIHDSVAALPIHYAYGAAGRAVTLINWSGIAGSLDFIVDGSALRYGHQIPNTDVPVISESSFLAGEREINDWCFVIAHNYLDGIRRRVAAAFPSQPFKWVTPLPHVAIH